MILCGRFGLLFGPVLHVNGEDRREMGGRDEPFAGLVVVCGSRRRGGLCGVFRSRAFLARSLLRGLLLIGEGRFRSL